MSFLSDLGSIVNEQLGFGENTTSSLNTTDDGRTVNFGLLGDFANKFDQSAHRSYVIDGFVRNVRPRFREILWQNPDMTVVIKKRMFSSLIENFRLDLLSDDEQLFYRSAKRLFQNKCRALNIYEKLTKIEKIANETGQVNSYLFPELLSGIAQLEQIPALSNLLSPETRTNIQRIRQVTRFSVASEQTNWVIDDQTPFMSETGEGTGVIELTLVTNVNTKSSTEFGAGSASFSIEDPYKILSITDDDIDIAINDATNFFENSAFGRFTEQETQRLIDRLKNRLNTERQNRGASQIRFIVSPKTLISKRVRAIVEAEGREIRFQYNSGLVGLGSSVEIDSADVSPSERLGNEALSSSEARLFKDIISNLFLILGFRETSDTQIKEFKGETNHVRQKLRLHFSGKRVIQPMDIVNIFISTKSQHDDKITRGFEFESRGQSLGNKLDSLVNNINTSLQNLSGASDNGGNSYEDIERTLLAGADFPPWLWRLFRNDFTKQPAGTAVFVGLVKNASGGYDDGKYMVNISCEDNSGYLNKSQINIRPALDVFNGTLYDPLTPFKLSFDAATGSVVTDIQQGQFPELLDENKILLNSEAVRFKTTRLRGNRISDAAYRTQNVELESGGKFRNIIANPDGLVYRWKEGIQAITKTDRVSPDSSVLDERTPLLTDSPFAGQDVINVLSLLITGQPYNFNSFLKSAIANVNGPLASGASGDDLSRTYLDALTDDLTRRNAIWGNFVPFKKMVFDSAAERFLRYEQADFINKNTRIKQLQLERAKLMDQLALRNFSFARDNPAAPRDSNNQVQPQPDGTTVSTDDINIRNRINELDREIELSRLDLQIQSDNILASKPEGQISLIGDDISLNPSFTDGNENSTSEEQRRKDKKEFRDKINGLTRRRLWQTKANIDQNFLIIDDQYDNNGDIQAFSRGLSNALKLFESDYTTPSAQIQQVADILGLEVFANTQGHIEVRPPQYNRMPSSVFYNMFQQKAQSGVQVFPQFLESLFFNQLQGVTNQIEIVEDEIRLRATVLGIIGDSAIEQFIRGSGQNSVGSFNFTTGEATGRFGEKGFKNMLQQSKPEFSEELVNGPLKAAATTINNALRPNSLFTIVARENALANVNFQAARSQNAENRIYDIRKRLERFKGVRAKSERDLISDDRFRRINQISQLDSLKLINEIANFIAERQKLLLSASNAIKNLSEGVLLNEGNKGATAALFPNLFRNKEIPSIIEHMIEDEDVDDLGPGSGQRYVIKDRDIVRYQTEEVAPPFTLVEVNGLFGEGFVDAPTNLRLTNGGGNAVVSAFAVDYDMWRMYGFRSEKSVAAPFFNNPDTQCAPYAVYLLNLARKNVIQGSITVAGNEYYQPGDVVYIEDEDMLFYVTDVAHNFGWNSFYTTTLTLKYGHKPGIYIPTILDIVGKILYNSRESFGYFRNSRFDHANGDIPIGSLIFDNHPTQDAGIDQLLNGTAGQQNQTVLNNLLLSVSGALNPVGFRNVQPKLELRVYYSGNVTGVANDALVDTAESVIEWLKNPEQKAINPGIQLMPEKKDESQGSFGINDGEASVVTVNISENGERSPSSTAWNSVRKLLRSNAAPGSFDFPGQPSRAQDEILSRHIIDLWITFESVIDTPETRAPGQSALSEYEQGIQEQIANARKKRADT